MGADTLMNTLASRAEAIMSKNTESIPERFGDIELRAPYLNLKSMVHHYIGTKPAFFPFRLFQPRLGDNLSKDLLDSSYSARGILPSSITILASRNDRKIPFEQTLRMLHILEEHHLKTSLIEINELDHSGIGQLVYQKPVEDCLITTEQTSCHTSA